MGIGKPQGRRIEQWFPEVIWWEEQLSVKKQYKEIWEPVVFCMQIWWWIHGSIHLSKLIQLFTKKNDFYHISFLLCFFKLSNCWEGRIDSRS